MSELTLTARERKRVGQIIHNYIDDVEVTIALMEKEQLSESGREQLNFLTKKSLLFRSIEMAEVFGEAD
jgi:hypothetical protein